MDIEQLALRYLLGENPNPLKVHAELGTENKLNEEIEGQPWFQYNEIENLVETYQVESHPRIIDEQPLNLALLEQIEGQFGEIPSNQLTLEQNRLRELVKYLRKGIFTDNTESHFQRRDIRDYLQIEENRVTPLDEKRYQALTDNRLKWNSVQVINLIVVCLQNREGLDLEHAFLQSEAVSLLNAHGLDASTYPNLSRFCRELVISMAPSARKASDALPSYEQLPDKDKIKIARSLEQLSLMIIENFLSVPNNRPPYVELPQTSKMPSS